MGDVVVSTPRHHIFTVSRELDAPPGTVFRVFEAEPLRRIWFRMPGRGAQYEFDFRPGGRERATAVFPLADGGEEQLENHAWWIDIEPDRRLVYGYETIVNDRRMWTALVTIELHPAGAGTRLDWTEQAVFLNSTGDGSADLPHLRGATVLRLNGLAKAVAAARS
jgi:uncharacterized protein YndB with AHSA1/START domain